MFAIFFFFRVGKNAATVLKPTNFIITQGPPTHEKSKLENERNCIEKRTSDQFFRCFSWVRLALDLDVRRFQYYCSITSEVYFFLPDCYPNDVGTSKYMANTLAVLISTVRCLTARYVGPRNVSSACRPIDSSERVMPSIYASVVVPSATAKHIFKSSGYPGLRASRIRAFGT